MLVAGPVRAGLSSHEWIEERARFLSGNFDENLLRTRTELLNQEQMIDQARHDEEVVLWFEHDLFCLVNFLYLLGRLAKARHLAIIWCPQLLGTMSEGELAKTFESRSAATPAMLRSGASAWEAYASDDPTALNRWVADTTEFAFLRDGFLLHASRFPSVRGGLGAVEKIAMEGIANGANDFLSLFGRFNDVLPRWGFGDSYFMDHLRRLASCAVPMITMTQVEGATPPKTLLALTPAGQNVLDAKVDFIELNNAALWLGGAHLTRERIWRWDEQRREIAPSRSAG